MTKISFIKGCFCISWIADQIAVQTNRFSDSDKCCENFRNEHIWTKTKLSFLWKWVLNEYRHCLSPSVSNRSSFHVSFRANQVPAKIFPNLSEIYKFKSFHPWRVTEGADAQMQSVWRDGRRIVTCPLVAEEAGRWKHCINIHIQFLGIILLLYPVSYRHICECRGRRLIVSGHWTVQSGERERERERERESAAGMGNEGICWEWLMNPIVLS